MAIPPFKPILLTVIACQFAFQSHSQPPSLPSQDLVSVSLHIIAKGTIQRFKSIDTGYFCMTTVTNLQDTTIRFWIFTCSWYWFNFVVDNDSVLFGGNGCDANFPILIKLAPHRSIYFNGIITSARGHDFCRTVRLGFGYYDESSSGWDIFLQEDNPRKSFKAKIYWSNPAELQNNLFDFQIEDKKPGEY